jgi:hypothetical protein
VRAESLAPTTVRIGAEHEGHELDGPEAPGEVVELHGKLEPRWRCERTDLS